MYCWGIALGTLLLSAALMAQANDESDLSLSGNGFKRYGWTKADTMWGKRAGGSWARANTMWGKRAWGDANTMWGKRNWAKANTMWGKRAWGDANTMWGRR